MGRNDRRIDRRRLAGSNTHDGQDERLVSESVSNGGDAREPGRGGRSPGTGPRRASPLRRASRSTTLMILGTLFPPYFRKESHCSLGRLLTTPPRGSGEIPSTECLTPLHLV